MALEILAIGDTGAELVSKFNGNFTEVDDAITVVEGDIAALEGSFDTKDCYSLTDYSCVGDGATDNTTAFNSLLSTISTNQATIKVPNGRFLIGTCTIPANVELIFINGGRIIWKTGATVTIYGLISAGHKWIFENQSEVVANLPSVRIHRQEFITPIWWGGKMSGNTTDKTINYNAFRACWNAAGRVGQTQDGCSIRFPSGTYVMSGMVASEDGFNATAKMADISGAGRSKTTIMLANGENKRLFYLYNNFDFAFKDLAFDGNDTNNPGSAGIPLVHITYYRVDFINVAFRNSVGDGLWITEGQSNSYELRNILAYNLVNAIKLYDSINVTLSGAIDIEAVTTGVLVTGAGTTLYDSRYNSRTFISGSWYAENVIYLVKLVGIGGVKVNINAYARYCYNIIHMSYDDARGMPCLWNSADITTSRDEKGVNQMGVVIGDKCCWNRIWLDPGTTYTDSDGRNSVNGTKWCEYIPTGDRTALVYNPTTNAAGNTISSGGTRQSGSIFNSVFSHNSTFGGPCHVQLSSYSSFSADTLFPNTTATFYVLLHMKGEQGAQSYVWLQSHTTEDVHYYDHPRKLWVTAGDWSAYANKHFILDLSGNWQTFLIPFTAYDTTHLHRCSIYSGGANTTLIDYEAFVSSIEADFIHKKSGTIIGYGIDSPVLASTSLPSAAEVNIGTQAFTSNLKLTVISDGTNWYKPDGTTL